MQTSAETLGWLKRVIFAMPKWSYGRHSKFSDCDFGTHMPVVGAAGFATQNVAGLPGRSEQNCVHLALQKPRRVSGFIAQKPFE